MEEGRGEEVLSSCQAGLPLSSVLSPLLRRGERKKASARGEIVAARDDFDRYW